MTLRKCRVIPSPHQQNLRLGCAKTVILYPLPQGERRPTSHKSFTHIPLPKTRAILVPFRVDRPGERTWRAEPALTGAGDRRPLSVGVRERSPSARAAPAMRGPYRTQAVACWRVGRPVGCQKRQAGAPFNDVPSRHARPCRKVRPQRDPRAQTAERGARKGHELYKR
jgi:hypothetical protein